MKRLLNTIYVTTEGAWLKKDGANLVVEAEGAERGCRSALEAHGLDPQVGFLHTDRPGRAGLALDLTEELRPVLADRLALSLVNRGQVKADDFVIEEAGAVRLSDAARKAMLIAWQERKRPLSHPFLGETVPLGLVAYLQAQLLARRLRGDLDGYPAFLWR